MIKNNDMLVVKQLNKVYKTGFRALDDVSFSLPKGSFTGLLGVNGAGKTSLISSIAGINKFTGQISVNGYDVIRQSTLAKSSIGVVPQELVFDPFMNVGMTLKVASGLYGKKDNQEWINTLLERLDLKSKEHTFTRGLSGGMKRRLMVAQALVHKPPLIILDEPTAGVDVELRRNLWEFIRELHQNGHTILLTSHYLDEVEELCDQIIVIDKGKLVTTQSKAEFMARETGDINNIEIQVHGVPVSIQDEYKMKLVGDNTYSVQIVSSEAVIDFLLKLRMLGLKVASFTQSKADLEQVFLELLGKKK